MEGGLRLHLTASASPDLEVLPHALLAATQRDPVSYSKPRQTELLLRQRENEGPSQGGASIPGSEG